MQTDETKPAVVRIESKLEHALDVPIPGPGRSTRGYVRVPKYEARSRKPGVIETTELDAVTLTRLRHHYDWRPKDAKDNGKRRDELADDAVYEIGLMKITVLPPKAAPAAPKAPKASGANTAPASPPPG